MIEQVLRLIDRFVSTIGMGIGIVMLPLLIGVRIYEIIARKLFNSPSAFLQYVEWEAFTLLVLLTLGFAYVRDGHVRVDILRERLGPRARAAIELAGFLLFVVPLVWVVIWYGIDRVIASHEVGERAALALGRPWGWLIKASLPFGIGLFGLAALSAAVRNLRAIVSGRP